ncbi:MULTISPECIES: alpha/beta hydrolase [unclassified Burkholderia]|uniref:alpha/beta hydrolase n=1 Tax=unclassified Burkholderia TaxID=2613784 RepID=UPI000F5665E0|nr:MULTISPECIES: alpha/beta hydrolase [unclassified Burkholderia]RQR87510.1 alpha/beta hydrolase [Burkholderia sp. Bp9011]RQR96860.1 alpha/beta hydrolase [Burkholderia sp. Bp9010]RQS07466.1 alpha/beta hydrolase [Burkholderia sp. Bp8991]RQS30764.1 alpha/beta hydrolase [Burkholderia sp. Bp8995]RQS51557.1 alpha/beta hydrolase [Burkholderia sp. Bp8989]
MTILYRGMDRAALDAAYLNTKAIPDFPAVLASCQARSAALYAATPAQRDLRYGSRPARRFDWLRCGLPGAPLFVFIHGGYWQHCAKEDFAYAAAGPLARGFDVVLAEYTLAPDASMTDIVGEIGALLDHLAADPDRIGTGGRPIHLSGHSAGGHLTAVYRAHPAVVSALAISPLVDLEPISLCVLGEKLRLTAHEIAAYSPLRHVGPGAPTVVAVGAAELPELVRHAHEYADACETAGEPVARAWLPGMQHFTVLDDLARPDSAMLAALQAIAPR